MRTAYISHPDCLDHFSGDEDHPESPRRLQAIDDQLLATGLSGLLRHFDAPLVTREQLLRVHTAAYLDELARKLPTEGFTELADGDTWMNPHTLQAAARAAGAAVLAVDLVMAGTVDNAFCAVRPPGHHAEPGRALGFCLYNNVAVAVAHALAVHGLERVAVVDFDVHHGNGTEAAFADEPRVLFLSTFQHPYFPYTDVVLDHPNLIHAPLPAGANSAAFREAVMERWLPALEAFRPQLIFISAGFDGHLEDDMGDLRLREADYAWVTRELLKIADQHAHGRLVSVLEGGYVPDALARSVQAHVRALMQI